MVVIATARPSATPTAAAAHAARARPASTAACARRSGVPKERRRGPGRHAAKRSISGAESTSNVERRSSAEINAQIGRSSGAGSFANPHAPARSSPKRRSRPPHFRSRTLSGCSALSPCTGGVRSASRNGSSAARSEESTPTASPSNAQRASK